MEAAEEIVGCSGFFFTALLVGEIECLADRRVGIHGCLGVQKDEKNLTQRQEACETRSSDTTLDKLDILLEMELNGKVPAMRAAQLHFVPLIADDGKEKDGKGNDLS